MLLTCRPWSGGLFAKAKDVSPAVSPSVWVLIAIRFVRFPHVLSLYVHDKLYSKCHPILQTQAATAVHSGLPSITQPGVGVGSPGR